MPTTGAWGDDASGRRAPASRAPPPELPPLRTVEAAGKGAGAAAASGSFLLSSAKLDQASPFGGPGSLGQASLVSSFGDLGSGTATWSWQDPQEAADLASLGTAVSRESRRAAKRREKARQLLERVSSKKN